MPHQRPLSPHLQVYRWSLTMLMSIVHRATGVVLSLGSILLVIWIASVAAGPNAYAMAQGVVTSPIGLLLLFGWSVALFYHLCNGIRHLFWDIGMGFEKAQARRSGWAALAGTAILTLATWGIGLSGAI
ncbi:MAG: succinate dehydrogenase, cytochrome b556 subunit [Candidatus Macondimonas sp.]